MGRKDPNKPKGAMSSYAFFVQTCREEHRKKHPGESVSFAEFSKKCSQRWREMGPKEKRRFEEMAERDKERYNGEMVGYEPPPGEKSTHKRKRVKDPNAPKRSMSAFFFFCGEERPSVKAANPGLSVGEIAKILGKKWEVCDNKPKFEANAATDKLRYEKAMAIYKGKKAKPTAPAPAAPPAPVVAPPKAPAAAAQPEESEDSDSDEDDSSDDDDDDDDDE